MNKNAIQKYAIWARNELIEQVKQRAFHYGITEIGYGDENATVISGRVLSDEEKKQRKAFIDVIKRSNYQVVIEEVAYTWFNRFVALRYMEVNDFLPTHVRVLSDANESFKPEILTNVLHLELPGLDKGKVSEYLNNNQTQELYRYLLLTQCNALNELLPEMFEKLGAYTEMLLPNNILKSDGVIGRLVNDIPEEDFKDAIEIIGWLYQYYNTEPKQEVFDGLKKNIKITKEKIPAATQLFTPDWIVRYMVENSLGRLWLDSHPNSRLRENWKYYLDEAEQTPEVTEQIHIMRTQSPIKSPEEIKFFDPCMGSGHILVYAFDILMQIYISEGYSERDAAQLILQKNLYGLDIDRRAYQLAYFAVMMKARYYNRRILTLNIQPQLFEPTGYPDGMEFGSLIKVNELEPMPEKTKDYQANLFDDDYDTKFNTWNFRRLLAQKYDVVVTNPPYMGSKGMSLILGEFVSKYYTSSKGDLFAVFIEKCNELLKQNGFQAMITQHSFMFLASYEKLRIKLLQKNIVNLVHLGANGFEEISGEVVQSAMFVLQNSNVLKKSSLFIRLVEYKNSEKKRIEFHNKSNYFTQDKSNFYSLSAYPFIYWFSTNLLKCFESKSLGEISDIKQGLITADNDRFQRLWFEIPIEKFSVFYSSNTKWFPYRRGGNFRKWFGNNEAVVNWQNDGEEIRKNIDVKSGKVRSRVQNESFYFREAISWSFLGSNKIGVRWYPQGQLFDLHGSSLFSNRDLLYFLALLNSKPSALILSGLNPTLSFQVGDISRVPVIMNNESKGYIETLTQENISIAKNDWDSFETSWDFQKHPFLSFKAKTITESYALWQKFKLSQFEQLRLNEEEINKQFIEIYGLEKEIEKDVSDSDILASCRLADISRDVESFISYFVGCTFGRYSLDKAGLVYAGGEWDASQYKTLSVDTDNIIPILDDEYFEDDIVGRFVTFIKMVYGPETLEENLKFIADTIGGKGTSRELIRNYFLNDFFTNHCKIYQKKPIYWLFDSGNKNGFKALIYMHRYSRDLLAKLRTDYVHEQQERYRTQLSHITGELNTAVGTERSKLLKQQEKLTVQLKEITVFEEKVHHLADQHIEIDLDDGIKKNYEIFVDILAKI